MRKFLVLGALLLLPLAAPAQEKFEDSVAKLDRLEGLLPVYLDRKGGRVLAAFKPSGAGLYGEYLYQVYMRTGLGSTPVGLDRGAANRTQIIAFRRSGNKLFAELENSRFRADKGDAAEKNAVRESFAASTLWSGKIDAEAADGSILVDISGFLTRDAFGVVDALRRAKQGDYRQLADLSHPDLPATLAFPENLEFEAHQTFTSDRPGEEVTGIAPAAHEITLVEHHSLIKLPEPGYQTRLADPRSGAIAHLVADYATPLDAPVVYRLAHRFRLEKTDPTAARSTVKKPIIFYVDNAAPEPVRSALLEGARWWSQAFEAAGFIDAFRVEVLPEGVNPLDARYNVINWVHRQTRGWSYGQNISDPRTGEIVKGAVLLGSLRVRQDRMIFEGLAGADRTGKGGIDDPMAASLARLRQLAVHETGHAIGLEHNFAASSYDDRASVMDYPSPRIKIAGPGFDFRDAYKIGIGSWDKFAIDWLYHQSAPGQDEAAELNAIVHDAYAKGARFATDADARPTGAGNRLGALWDDGADPVAELAHVLEVRKLALAHFGLRNLPDGAPLADLRRIIVPVYLFHRYQLDAVAKAIGGSDFTYAVKGDGLTGSAPVPAAEQRRSLAALLASLDPKVLALPAPLVDLLSAGQSSVHDKQTDIEIFGSSETPQFSLTAAASAAADIVFANLFDPSRLNRVAEQAALDPRQLSLPELLAAATDTASGGGPLRDVVLARLVGNLAATLQDKAVSPATAAAIRSTLTALAHKLQAGDAVAHYYADMILGEGDRLKQLAERERAEHPAPPPGMPIGEDDWFGQ